MPEASTSITRRGFLGHVAGAYTAVALAAGATAAVTLASLIARHRHLNDRWGEACIAWDADESDENDRICTEWRELQEEALYDLLAYRPTTVEEVGQRFAYIYGKEGPWRTFMPDYEQMEVFIASMMPEGTN